MLFRSSKAVVVVFIGLSLQIAFSAKAWASNPVINSFSPTSGVYGDTVTINGSFFTSGPTVKFAVVSGGTANATIVSSTTSQIRVMVPAAVSTGPITVMTINGTTSSSTPFTVPLPVITSFNPTSGVAGDVVTVNGSGFATGASNSMWINGVAASSTSISATQLTTVVPSSATTGPIKVRVGTSNSYTTSSNFTIGAAPSISSFSPTSAVVGAQVIISGANFGTTATADAVTFNGIPAVIDSSSTATKIYTNVPSSATTGPITVTVNGRTGSGSTFTVTTSTAAVATIAGLAGIIGATDGVGSDARFGSPASIAADALGNAYVVDDRNSIVRKITAAGVVTTLAGQAMSYGSADGTGSAARFNYPAGIASDDSGNLYVADTINETIRKITPSGVVTTIAGLAGSIGSTDGMGSAARFNYPEGIAVDASGNIYVAEWQNHTIRKIAPGGVVTTLAGLAGIAGNVDGTGSTARFNQPTSVSVDASGNLYVGDGGNNSIRKVSSAGVVTTVENPAGVAGSADGSPTSARFSNPLGLTVDKAGNVYVADSNNNTIRAIGAGNAVTTIAGVAGTAGSSDGTGSAGLFNFPAGIIADSCGNLLATDYKNYTIRKITISTTCPAKPAITVPTSVGTTFNVSWTLGTGGGPVTYYVLRQATATSGPWAIVSGNIDSTQTTYTVTVPGSGTYYYEIAACNQTSCSPYAISSGVLVTTPPNAPTSVSVPASSAGSFTVSWTPSSSGTTVANFILQQSTSATGPWTVLSNNIHATQTSYNISAPAGTYYFEVAACNGGCGAYTVSSAIVVTPPPNAPTVSVPATSSSAIVTFSWTASATGGAATSFQISRSTTSTGSWTSLASSLSASARSYQDTVPGNGTFYYQVGACNVSGCANGVSSGVVVTIVVTAPQLPPVATPVNDLPSHDATVGTMAGKAGTDGGAATYTIPIVVPPGRAGMQPSLSLNYNSRSGDGVMGMGWTIGGLSSIHRCPQTPEQDGQTLGVSYTASDKLCLDGQRLVVVNGVAYGNPGAEYRTEVDSYARIYQTGGGLTSAAACFRVEQKDGRVLHYGAITSGSPTPTACNTSSANARVQAAGAASTLSWLVEKIEDRIGNNQLYTYSAFGNGENLPRTVTYTGFGATAGDRVVTFNYETRSAAASSAADIASSYLVGGLTMQTQALASIATSVSGVTVRTYTPTYAASSYSGRLIMTRMQECATAGSSTACHPWTQFVYNDGGLNYPLTPLSGLGLPVPDLSADPSGPGLAGDAYSTQVIGDLDGDGTRETIIGVMGSSGLSVYLAQLTGDRAPQTAINLTGFATGDPRDYVDIDGDGRAEAMRLPQTSADDQHVTFNVWKLARGQVAATAVQSGWTPAQNAAALFQNISTNIPYSYNNTPHGQSRTVFTADMNGDGRMDVVVVQPTSQCGSDALGAQDGVFVYLNNLTGVLGSSSTPFVVPAAPLICLTRTVSGGLYHELAIDHIADFDGNGLPDLYLVYGGSDALAGAFAGIRLTQSAGGSLSVVVKTCTDIGLTNDATPGSTTDECNWQYQYAVRWLDINGDGLEDFVIARPNQGVWQARLNKGNGSLGSLITTTGSGSTAGLKTYPSGGAGSGYSFRYATKLPPMDVDADGKPELLAVSSANKFALKVCTTIKVFQNSDLSCPSVNGTAAPSTPSGTTAGPELKCLAYACPEEPDADTLNMPANTMTPGYLYQWNGVPVKEMYKSGFGANDNSVYHLAMVKFVQTGPAAIRADLIETPLVSRLTLPGLVPPNTDDLFGDGLSDLVTQVGCTNQQVTIPGTLLAQNACSAVDDGVHGPATFNGQPSATFATSTGLFGNINQGVPNLGGSPAFMTLSKNQQPKMLAAAQASQAAPLLSGPILPGLLDGVINGLGDTASWGYLPLSFKSQPQGGVPLYALTNNYVDSRHFYFQSSMPVVFGMGQSSGTGEQAGFRTAVYGYTEAMYHHLGRGFQGFHVITSISGDTINATDRFTRTATTYKQKYPLAGKVESRTLWTQDASGVSLHKLKTETDTWICNRNDRTLACPEGDALPTPTATTTTASGTPAYQPLLDKQVVQSFDLATGALIGETDTVNAASAAATLSGWDDYSCGSGSSLSGNLTDQTVVTYDKGSNLFVTSHTEQTQNCYDTTGANSWWINKLTGSTVTSSIAYASGHPLPSGASAPNQTVTTSFTWNSDRTPLTKVVQAGTPNQQSTTTYCYPGSTTTGCPSVVGPSYGLPTQVRINAPDLAAALSPTRWTSYSYTKNGSSVAADGYFVLNTTNALGHATTTYHQTTDGQVTNATDPNGIQLVTTYDPFGRATQVDHLGNNGLPFESPIKTSYTACSPGPTCSAGLVGEDDQEANAAYRVTTTQDGYPTKVTWYDLLGRPIKNAEATYTGISSGALAYKYSATLTTYDDNGTVSEQYAPYFIGSTPQYWTSFAYDAANRPIVKIEPRAELDSVNGDLETDYSYSGRTTNIVAHARSITPSGGMCPTTSTTNLCLQMSRSSNALGQLMQTTESPVLSAGSRRVLSTNYWTEPQGHVVAITDVEGNITTANYNALGQRTQSNDPDQGTWNFNYDAFGELLSQTDARGAVTTILSLDSLGRTIERQAVAPANPPSGMLADPTYDKWTYDPTYGKGQVDTILRRRGSSTTAPASNPIVWQESYTYEATTARPSTTTTSNMEGSVSQNNLLSQVNYDTYGRVNTHQYPSGLTVQNRYTSYGQIDALSNFSTGYVYWTALGQDEWQHTVAEQFPGVITGAHQNYHSTGQAQTLAWSGSVTDQMTYTYDSFANLVKQTRGVPYANNETYTYDALQRLTKATRASGQIVSYGYSDSGNLTAKTDFGTGAYSYGAANSRTNGCGPHAVYAVGSISYNCDANGNMISGGSLSMVYDANNQARYAGRGGSVIWTYNSLGERDFETDGTDHYFVGDGYRTEGGTQVHELGPVIVRRNGTVDTVAVALRDRLGSTLNVIDNGVPTARQYDPFGKPRNGDMSDRVPPTLGLQPDTMFGFTNHEHDDSVQLIHMKGRVFDYQLGRFLSVDPLIGEAQSSQGFNPYSYIGNNPLSGVDPTGYCAITSNEHACDGCGRFCLLEVGGTVSVVSPGNGVGHQAPLVNSQVEVSRIESLADHYSTPGLSGLSDRNGNPVGLSPTLTVTPDGAYSPQEVVYRQGIAEAEYQFHRESVNLALFPVGAALSLATGTNVWRHNVQGDDSIESASIPGPTGIVLKGALAVRALRTSSVLVGIQEIRGATNSAEQAVADVQEIVPGFGVNDTPSRFIGPWTQRDLQRAAEGKGPLDFVPMKNAAGKEVPLDLHHAGQMPGSAIHEAPPVHSRLQGLHPNKYNQGVTAEMRAQDSQLHWQLRGQEMGNPPPER